VAKDRPVKLDIRVAELDEALLISALDGAEDLKDDSHVGTLGWTHEGLLG
jgi:hypothetical protein